MSIPDNDHHKFGQIELPGTRDILGYTVYEEKLDPTKHFVIKQVASVDAENWRSLISSSGKDEALIFVHGFDTSFKGSLYRVAQIVWDVGYNGVPVLFSWASNGNIADYIYDQQSALIARKSFLDVLNILQEQGIKKINILAHSMGSFVVLDALQSLSILPHKQVSELILAAPDVDIDYYRQVMPKITQISDARTLYASSNDRALKLSRKLANNPRAGDVVDGKPFCVSGVETIDVSAIGDELLGLNHDVYSSKRTAIDDIGLILRSHAHPPDARLSEIKGMPVHAIPPSFWRYAN